MEKKPYEEPMILASYSKEELDESVQPQGLVGCECSGCGCGCCDP